MEYQELVQAVAETPATQIPGLLLELIAAGHKKQVWASTCWEFVKSAEESAAIGAEFFRDDNG